MSYCAIVTRLVTRPHPNADRLQLATCHGNQVVVGLDTSNGALGLFFPTDGQLSHEYCLANNLYTLSARVKLGLPPNAPARCHTCQGTGELQDAVGVKPCPQCAGTGALVSYGFIDARRRVRAQRFRGERSDGLWLPLDSLQWAGDWGALAEGNTLTEFAGQAICEKYYTPATLKALGNAATRQVRDLKTFPKHLDTKQFRFFVGDIPEGAVLYLTEKLHGTSGRTGLVWDDDIPRTGLAGLVNRLTRRWLGREYLAPTAAYRLLNGSRNVVLERTTGQGFYGTNDFRFQAMEGVSLHKGEVLYFELVGWVNATTPIMPPHDVTTTGLKDIRAQYGNTIAYTYGCPPGVCRPYVYRITQNNPDGICTELSWPQVKARCQQLGLSHVPELTAPLVYSGHAEYLQKLVESVTSGPSTLNAQQIREGVVLRVECTLGTGFLKNKAFEFGVLEGFWKEQDEGVDLEEAS
jgi:hypothetical protein